MMSEDDYLERVRELMSGEMSASPEVLRTLDEAVKAYPDSPRLWVRRGQMMYLAEEYSDLTVEDCLACFEKAMSLDPSYAKAYEEIGYYHDVYSNNYDRAEHAFRKAISLGAGVRSYEGLARVLAQLDRPHEALRFLAECPDDDEGRKKDLEKDIREGIWGTRRPKEEPGQGNSSNE